MKRILVVVSCLVISTWSHAEEPLRLEDLDAPFEMVEPEFDVSLLDNLPMPTTAPTNIILPRLIVEKDQWRGSLSGITRPVRVVIRKAEDWTKFWNLAIRPYSPGLPETPPVDFSKEMIVGVFMGEKPTPSYSTEIKSIQPQKDETVIVEYRNLATMQAVFSPPFAVQPFHLRRVRLYPSGVVFKEAGLKKK